MNAITENILREAADAFAFDHTTGEISRYGEGHINDTLALTFECGCSGFRCLNRHLLTVGSIKQLLFCPFPCVPP